MSIKIEIQLPPADKSPIHTTSNQRMCECSICYDEITKATGEVKLSCSHVFHFSCISSWFFKQEKGTCPCCRKEMGEKEDLAPAGGGAEDDEDDEDDEDEDDEDDDEDEIITLNRTELNAFLKRNDLLNPMISREQWDAMEFAYDREPEYQGEGRLVFTFHEFECFLATHCQKILGTDLDLWEDLLSLEETPLSEAFLSANLDFGMPLRLPSRVSAASRIKVTWTLLDSGTWTRIVFNPEEIAAVISAPVQTAEEAASTAAKSATKVQAVWRGFSSRVGRVNRVSA